MTFLRPQLTFAASLLSILLACGSDPGQSGDLELDVSSGTDAGGSSDVVAFDSEPPGADIEADTDEEDSREVDSGALDTESDGTADVAGDGTDAAENDALIDTDELDAPADADTDTDGLSDSGVPSDVTGVDADATDASSPDAEADSGPADVLDASPDTLTDAVVSVDATDAGADDADASSDAALSDVVDDARIDVADASDTTIEVEIPAQRVGIFYLAWHTYAATAILSLPEEQRLTVERVIRDGSLWVSDMLWDFGLVGAAAAFHWHAEPEAGFYCLYRRRPGDADPGAPDCPGISEVAESHARLLWDAGIDFVYADLTNLPEANRFADVLGVRPIEVLFEEWSALRRAGVATPQIGVWVPATRDEGAAAPLFREVVRLYERPEFADVLLRHEPTGQPVMFIVDRPGLAAAPGFLDEIRAAGIVPVRMWGNSSDATLQAGAAGWMQPCRDGGQFTTLVAADRSCNQSWSPATPIGSVVSVSASYQVGYASMPFQASGRQDGMTLRKQFETAFSVQPDYVLINAWNEHVAQPQPNPYPASLGNLRRAMGEEDPPVGDPYADSHWVDMYGTDLSRDLEPTVEGGRGPYELMRSCVRVYRQGRDGCAAAGAAGEACCDLRGGTHLVYSLSRDFDDGRFISDHVLTLNVAERDSLVRGGAFEEICNPAYAPPGLCGNGTTGAGPFRTWRLPAEGRRMLYRCFTGEAHFMSLDPLCEGRTVEGPLGYVSAERSSASPRSIRRCYNTDARRHFHWLGGACPALAGVTNEAVLGWVQ